MPPRSPGPVSSPQRSFSAPCSRCRGTLPPFRRFGRHDWLLLAVATVFLCINYLLYVLGLDRTNAGTAQVVIQLAPLLLAVGGVFVYGERLRAPQWLGFATMFAGFVLFSYEQISHLVGMLDRYYAGLVYIVLAAIAWAVYGLAQKQLLDRMRSPQVLLCLYVGGALVFAPLAEPARLLRLTPTELAALVFCIANMLGSYGTFAEALGPPRSLARERAARDRPALDARVDLGRPSRRAEPGRPGAADAARRARRRVRGVGLARRRARPAVVSGYRRRLGSITRRPRK